jgi:hypothetical protein
LTQTVGELACSFNGRLLENNPGERRFRTNGRKSRKTGIFAKFDLLNPLAGELAEIGGGLNGSTQHSAQNPHSLKTKAKSAG